MTKERIFFCALQPHNFLSVITIVGCSLGLDRPALAQAVFNGGNNSNSSGYISGTNTQGAPAFSIPFGPAESPASGQAPAPSPAANNNTSPSAPVTNVQGAPAFGTSVTLGRVPSFTSLQTSLPPPNRQILVTPSLGIEEAITNADFARSSGQAVGLATTISPGLMVAGQGPESDDIIIDYMPRITLYTGQSDQNQIAQDLNAAGDLTLVPNSLTVATRGYVTEQATSGGVNPGGTTLLSRNNTTTTQSYSVSPTYFHSFAGTGTLDLNYLLSYTNQGGNSAYLSTSSRPYFVAGNLTTQTETASFQTVPFYDRFDDIIASSTSQDISNGVLNQAHQYFFSDTLRAVIFRHFILSGSGGYEDLAYSGIPPTTVRDATWAVGIEIHPSAVSDIIAKYQHLYGINSPLLQASYALTDRTLLSANYSDFLGTQQQSIGSAVSGSSVDSEGQSVNSTSGAPILVSNQLLAQQSNLMRQSIFSLSTTTTWPRDSLSISILHDQQKLVAIAPGATGFSQNSASASISYTHDLSNALHFTMYFDDGTLDSEASSQKPRNVYSGMLALNYAVSKSLTTYAQLLIQNQSAIDLGATQLQYSLMFGLNKSF